MQRMLWTDLYRDEYRVIYQHLWRFTSGSCALHSFTLLLLKEVNEITREQFIKFMYSTTIYAILRRPLAALQNMWGHKMDVSYSRLGIAALAKSIVFFYAHLYTNSRIQKRNTIGESLYFYSYTAWMLKIHREKPKRIFMTVNIIS